MVAADGVVLHDFAAALNSSMAFAINLFMPFRCIAAAPLEIVLEQVLGTPVSVESISFEYVGDFNVLAETAGSRPVDGEKFTSADIGVIVRRPDGERGVVLIEVKLSEGGFTHCNGRESRGNRDREVCENSAAFFDRPDRCYLRRPYRASRDRRYWEIFAAGFGSVRSAFRNAESTICPFANDFQQIMRNHALAMGLVQTEHFGFWHYGLVHHDENPDVVPHWEDYRASVAEPGPLFRLPATQLLTQALTHGSWWVDWAAYMRARYFLP